MREIKGYGFTLEELLVANVSKELKDNEVGFIGMGTGGKGWVLAVGIPIAACALARKTHAPGFVLLQGPITEPRYDKLPSSFVDYEQIYWQCKSQTTVQDCLNAYRRGKIDKSFLSSAQIDKYGNLNIVCIGDYDKPKVVLVGGSIAQADHMSSRAANIIMMEHEKRRFVEKVDFISGAGYLDGPSAREKAGLPSQGPIRVYTNLAVLGFDDESKSMNLQSIHSGVKMEEVINNTGFELIIPDEVPTTPFPSDEELSLIRKEIDPNGLLLEGKMC